MLQRLQKQKFLIVLLMLYNTTNNLVDLLQVLIVKSVSLHCEWLYNLNKKHGKPNILYRYTKNTYEMTTHPKNKTSIIWIGLYFNQGDKSCLQNHHISIHNSAM